MTYGLINSQASSLLKNIQKPIAVRANLASRKILHESTYLVDVVDEFGELLGLHGSAGGLAWPGKTDDESTGSFTRWSCSSPGRAPLSPSYTAGTVRGCALAAAARSARALYRPANNAIIFHR